MLGPIVITREEEAPKSSLALRGLVVVRNVCEINLSGGSHPLSAGLLLHVSCANLYGSKVPKHRVCAVYVSGIVTTDFGRYLSYGYLDPQDHPS